MPIHDVHAHLTHARLLPDVEAVVARARSAGVATIITNGLNPEDNAQALELASRFPGVHAAVGLYPVDAVLHEMSAAGHEYPRAPGDWSGEDAVRDVVEHADQAIAIGEVGLDGHWVPEAFWDRQEQLFRELVRLAVRLDKPLIVHTRKRERRAREILVEEGATRVDWHCFGSRVKLARQVASDGHWLSIPANARRSESFTRMIQTVRRDRLLLETDCPYLGPERGVTNEPANAAGTANYMAELWGEPRAAVEELLADNLRALFGPAVG